MIKKKDITEIYDAALKVFAEYGYKKTTLADIAQKLNMTGSNFYRYFKSKQDLYEQTVSHALLQWQAYSRNAIPPDEDTRTQFTTMCHKAVEYLSINDTFRQLLIRDPDIFPIFPENDPYEKINNDSVELVKSVLKKGIGSKEFRDTDLELTTQLLWLIYKTFIMQIYVKNHGKAMQDSWKVFIDLITNGLFSRLD
ncbi:MAG: TetR/AcrR family transcriptional regulator [Desulfobacteraceae bacterium]|nr:TetR/AcrR family transcriptional regulator [Desulfobacteraceae bacterium]MBC2755392.1 TetR/AcrR family transcriptional regulator [Desulfobacteraceae bacterium]